MSNLKKISELKFICNHHFQTFTLPNKIKFFGYHTVYTYYILHACAGDGLEIFF